MTWIIALTTLPVKSRLADPIAINSISNFGLQKREILEALAYAFGECVLLAIDTDDQGKAQANFTISTATQLAYLDSITPDEEDE